MSSRGFAGWWFVSALLCANAASAEGKLFAVLPLDVRMTHGQMSEAAQTSIEEMLRDESANHLAQAGWTVLTGETTLQVLSDNGVDIAKCNDEGCHLSIAREIDVDRFISGSVQYADDEFTASIRLIDTRTGRILSSEHISGKTAHDLRSAFEPRVAEFFSRASLAASGPQPAADANQPADAKASQTAASQTAVSQTAATQVTVSQVNEAPVPPPQGSLHVTSTPSGATVTVDGAVVGTTPLTKTMPVGSYDVSMEMPGYVPVWKPVVIDTDRESSVSERMVEQRLFIRVLADSYIKVLTNPPGASVFIDGRPAGTGRQGPFTAGRHTVSAQAEGYRPTELNVAVSSGTTALAILTLTRARGAVMVSTNVEADCSAQGIRARVNPGQAERLDVAAGNVAVTCRRLGYEDLSRVVKVLSDEMVFLPMTLLPREDARTTYDASSSRMYDNSGSRTYDSSSSTQSSDSSQGGLEIRVVSEAPEETRSDSTVYADPSANLSSGTFELTPSRRAAPQVQPEAFAAPEPGPAAGARSWVEPKSGLEFVYFGNNGSNCADDDVFCKAEDTLGTGSSVPPAWVTRGPVTVAAYARCIESGACPAPGPMANCDWTGGSPNQAVTCIGWQQAARFCRWTGGRLPDQALWESAARSVDRTAASVPSAWDPSGQAPVPALQTIERLWEWTGSSNIDGKVIETLAGTGGPWGVRTAAHRTSTPALQSRSLGFRCSR
jgi:hypothetical protein